MQQRIINFLKMTSGIIAGMQKEKSVWEDEEEIVAVFTDVVNVYTNIESKNHGILGTDTTGFTNEKDNLFDKLTHLTYKLCKKMSGYAKRNKDYALLPLVDVSLLTLQRGIEKEAVERCAAIVEKATVLLPQLASFKVNDAQLTTIKEQIKAYNTSLDTRTATGGSLTVSGSEISERIAALREHFDVLDDLVEGLIEEEGFIARYKSWRRIVDYGKGKTLPNNPVKLNN